LKHGDFLCGVVLSPYAEFNLKESCMNLTGSILIAMPNLLDPNFHRAVVLILEHTEEGTLGLVLNRKSMLTGKEICDMQELSWVGGDEQVRVGGPVQPNSVWMLHGEAGDDLAGSQRVFLGCHFTTSKEGLKHVAHRTDGKRVIFGGYAGWETDQLTSEIQEGTWLTHQADQELVFDEETEDLWEKALQSLGIDPGSLVPGGGLIQ
jgi:putative transcriptional regulator